MNKIVGIIPSLSLVVLLLAPVLFYFNQITMETNKLLLLIATVVWFVTATYCQGKKQ